MVGARKRWKETDEIGDGHSEYGGDRFVRRAVPAHGRHAQDEPDEHGVEVVVDIGKSPGDTHGKGRPQYLSRCAQPGRQGHVSVTAYESVREETGGAEIGHQAKHGYPDQVRRRAR